MPYNGSGVFSRLYNWVTEQASPPIAVSKLDTQEQDFATAFNNCLLRDGTGVPTAATPWNGQNLTGAGTVSATLFSGSGASLTNLPAANLTGSIADARLSANVPLKDVANVYALTQTITSGSMSAFIGGDSAQGWTGTSSAHPFQFYTTNILRGFISAAGGWVIELPTTGTSLSVASSTAQRGISITAAAGQIAQLTYIQDGQTEATIYMGASANTLNFEVNGALRMSLLSGMQLGSPTGGDKGAGTLNAASTIYVNNVAVALGNALNASALTSGTVPDERFPATLPAASGENLTALTAANIAAGTAGISISGNAATATKSYLPTAGALVNGEAYHAAAGFTINSGDIASGGTYTVVNTTGSAITITQGTATIRKVGTTDTGNCTLAEYGIATIRGISSGVGIITGVS